MMTMHVGIHFCPEKSSRRNAAAGGMNVYCTRWNRLTVLEIEQRMLGQMQRASGISQ